MTGASAEQPWRVVWLDDALRAARRLDRRTRERIITAIERLAVTEYGDVAHLTSPQHGADYLLRVGTWRVLFNRETNTHTLIILHVVPRGRAYRD